MMNRREIVEELHKQSRKIFPRKSVSVRGIDDLWQADLMMLDTYSKYNSGYKYLLVVIDSFSKFLWVRRLKNKTGIEVAKNFKDILDNSDGRVCSNLNSDRGTEFYNSYFRKLMNEYNINHYSTYTFIKATFVERVIRTIRERLGKVFTLNGNYNWVDTINQVVHSYNNTKHTKIKLKPTQVNKTNEKFILKSIYTKKKVLIKEPKYKIGDIVRISKFKKLFEKSTTRNWSTELFKIVATNKKYPPTYLLEDYQGHPILGQFYEPELLKTKYPDIFLIDQVIKKKGSRSFVSWLGFDQSHNSWIENKNLI